MSKKKSSDEIEIKIPNIGKVVNKTLKKIFNDGWAVISLILAILLVIIVFNNQGLTSGTSGVSPEVAAQNVVDFAAGQGAVAEIVSTKDAGDLYEVVLSIEGQEVPIYVTKDGQNLIPSLVPLTGNTIAADNVAEEVQEIGA